LKMVEKMIKSYNIKRYVLDTSKMTTY
jgi:hypothetical protein